MGADASGLAHFIRDIPDHPEPGVVFKDITPLLADAAALDRTIDALVAPWVDAEVAVVAGIEARGFILAPAIALRLGAGFVPVRKQGKLPWETLTLEYALEYGVDAVEVHTDAVGAGDRVLLIDDVLATGGTAAAAVELLEGLGATVVGAGFLIELEFLSGRKRLDPLPMHSVVGYG